MGMSQGAYWVSWMAFDVVLTFATALLLVLFGEFCMGGVGWTGCGGSVLMKEKGEVVGGMALV